MGVLSLPENQKNKKINKIQGLADSQTETETEKAWMWLRKYQKDLHFYSVWNI